MLPIDHPVQLERHRPSGKPNVGHISPAAQKGLEKPTGTTRLRTNDLPKGFGYLRFLLSVRGDQAIHPSQEDPTAENQGEKERH